MNLDSRVRAVCLVLLLGAACLSAGCGGKGSASSTQSDRAAFEAPPDPSKMSPEQRKMYEQFSHGAGGATPTAAPGQK